MKKKCRFYKNIIEHIHDGIVVIDAESKVVYINEKMASKFGYSAAELIGMNIEDNLAEEGRQIVRRAKAHYLSGSKNCNDSSQSDIKVKCKDGSDIWMLVSVTPVYGNAGELIGSYGILTDIHQRKIVEMNLQLLSAAVDAISESLVIIDSSCTIIWSNQALEELTGYHLDEITGKNISLLLPADDDSLKKDLSHHVETCQPWCLEFVNQKKDQTTYHEEFTLVPVRQERELGNRYFIIVKRDISKQYEVQLEQQRLNEKAESLAIAEMRAQISRELHDSVSQLIYSMTILAETGKRLIRANDIQQLKENQENIYQASRQALREIRLLVYELRPHERVQEGLAGRLRKRLDSVERRAGLETHLILQNYHDLPKKIEQELFNIVQEALNNVLKHSQADMVVVLLKNDEQFLTLEINDNGLGIDDCREDTGGIGLDSMKERAEQVGGELNIISLESQHQHGTQVILQIPQSKLL